MTENLRQRPGDQPLPTPNQHPAIAELVQADIEQRRQLGISRYGTPLQPFNGRDALRDLYEELLDGACYIRQALYERAPELAEVDRLREQLAAAEQRAEKAEAQIAALGNPETEQGIRWPNGNDEQWCGYSPLAIMATAADQGGQYIERIAYRGPWFAAGGRLDGPGEMSRS